MIRQYILRKMIRCELDRYEKLYSKLVKRLPELPKATLSIKRNKIYSQMRIDGKQYTTLIVNDNQFVSEVKERRYIKKGLPILKKKIDLCRNFLLEDVIYNPKEIQKELPKQYIGAESFDVFLDGKVTLKQWLKSGNRNPLPFYEEHCTNKGVKCRSKSEAMIGTCLELRGLIYIYEPEIKLGNRKVYPDFAIYLPKSGRVVYFEHFGKISDPRYAARNFFKFAEYAEAGIYVGINLFYTAETASRPLTMNDINRTIDKILALDAELLSNA